MSATHDKDTVAGWRGQELVDQEGDKVGKIADIYLDRMSDHPEWVTVKMGLLGRRQAFVPIRDATAEGKMVRVPFDKAHVERAPDFDPDQGLSPHQEAQLYSHYGIDYPALPTASEHSGDAEGQHPPPAQPSHEQEPSQARAPEQEHDRQPEADVPDGAEQSSPSTEDHADWKVDRLSEEPAGESGEQFVEPRLRLKKYIVHEEVRIPVEREETRIERE